VLLCTSSYVISYKSDSVTGNNTVLLHFIIVQINDSVLKIKKKHSFLMNLKFQAWNQVY
jgi:hypothetical protein